jgi:hypothetical protein
VASTKAKQPEPEQPTSGSTPFINKNTANEAYGESKKWLRTYFDPIEELERLARGKPSNNIPKGLPRITENTLSGIITEQPKRVVQQSPTGLVSCKDYPEYAKIADIVLSEKIRPMYNRQGNDLQKSWNMLGKAMTWGRSTSYTFFTSTNGQMHTDYVIPYVKDILTEKGKVFAPDSNIAFMRSWYQKRDLQAIINKEKALLSKSKDYKSDWDLKLLAQFMEGGASAKPADVQTPAEKEKGGDTGGFEVIHAFQAGIGAEFYSFSPQFQDGVVLRSKINKDPRGQMPLDFLYCNIDLSNPLGRGQVELSGGIQNLIDQQMQMFMYMSTLMQAPPVITFGNVNKASMKMRPNAVWDGGTSGTNRIEPLKIDNTQIANFTSNQQYLQSKIFQLNQSQDHSIGADNGNEGQSKTQAGVQAQEARLGVSDNYLRKQFEDWKGDQDETSLNIFFSEMTGSTKIKLKPEDLKEIMKSDTKKFVKKDMLEIPYKDISDVVFKFEVDPSSSEVKEDADNVDKLTEVYKILQSDPDPSLADKKAKLLKILIDEIGAEGTDDLFPELDDKQQQVDENGQPVQQQPQQQQVTPQMVQQMVMEAMQQAEEAKKQQPKTIAESLAIKFSDLPEDAKQQVLEQIGIHSTMPSPSHIDQTNKILDSAHNDQHAQDVHQFNVDKAAVDTLQADGQQQQDNQMAQAQQDQSAQQAEQDNQLKQQQANSPESSENGKVGDSPSQLSTGQQPLSGDQPLDPEEEQFVHMLTLHGFDENDCEQGILMRRQGMPDQQILELLGRRKAQYATQ